MFFSCSLYVTEVQSAGFAQVEDHVDHLVVCRLFSFFNVFKFDEFLANLFEVVQSHLYVFEQSAYTPVAVMFRGGVRGWTYMLNFFLKTMIHSKSHDSTSHLIFL